MGEASRISRRGRRLSPLQGGLWILGAIALMFVLTFALRLKDSLCLGPVLAGTIFGYTVHFTLTRG